MLNLNIFLLNQDGLPVTFEILKNISELMSKFAMVSLGANLIMQGTSNL